MLGAVSESFRLLQPDVRRRFIVLTALRGLTNLLDLAGLLAIGTLGALLASGLGNRESISVAGFTFGEVSNSTILWAMVAVVVFFAGKSILSVWLLNVQKKFLSDVEAKLASGLLRYLHGGPISRFQRFDDGKILWLVNMGSQMAISGLLVTFSAIVIETVLFAIIFVLFIAVEPLLAVGITLYFVFIVGVFQLAVKRRISELGEEIRANSIDAMNAAKDLGVAFREIGVLGKRDYFFTRFDLARRALAFQMNRQLFLLGLPRYIVETALMIGVLGLVAWQLGRGEFSESLGVIAIFLAGGVRMMAALLPLQNAITNIRIYAPQAAPVHALAREAGPGIWTRSDLATQSFQNGADRKSSEPKLGSGRVSLSPNLLEVQRGCALHLDDVSFSYPGSAVKALAGVSLSVDPGAFVAFIGPSGAGKSTLADVLLGVHESASGTVLIDEVEPIEFRERFPGMVSYVPQVPGIVAGSIAQNVALGTAEENVDFDRLNQVLKQSQLEEFVASLPDGVNTDLGSYGHRLSGGQKQRLGLARALYSRPRLVVLDEATSALDARTEAGVAEMLKEIGQQTTLVVIAHRLSTVQHADRVFVLEGGTLISSGSFRDVRREVPMVEQYVKLMRIADL